MTESEKLMAAREVIKPYVCERFGKNGQTYSLKCGRCNKTVQTKWNYCPFCGAKLREEAL